MPAERSPRLAAVSFLDALGATVRCVTDRHLTVPTHHRVGDLYAATFAPHGDPAPLRAPRGGSRGLSLDVVHLFQIVETERVRSRPAWRVTTRMEQYALLDHDERELLTYHWQPGPDFAGPDHPHLHVSAALDARVDAVNSERLELDRRHVATGRVSLEAVVRMLVEEFGVAPRRGDWRAVLHRNEAAFRREATQRP